MTLKVLNMLSGIYKPNAKLSEARQGKQTGKKSTV